VRTAVRIARTDPKWANALRGLFKKLKEVLDKCLELADGMLPNGVRKYLKELKDEVDNFLAMKSGAGGKSAGRGNKTDGQSSGKANDQGMDNHTKPTEKLDKNPKKEYEPDNGNGPNKAKNKSTTEPSRTKPSGKKGGKPRGERAPESGSQKRKHKRENESADTLADAGYDVDQGPHTKPDGKSPDYKIEDEYFDCLAPDTDNVDQVRKGISRKVKSGQTERIILNMDDTNLKPSDITEVLQRKPKQGLKEVIGIKKGKITRIFP
jgi:hypothetical protein